MNNPKVSVIMSVYNGEKYLREAIDSILSQTFNDFEFIIINDGSTDNSKNILDSYSDGRMRIFHNSNKGLIGSLNEAIGYCRGEFIARMDADDICNPNRFDQQIMFFKNNPECVLVGSHAQIIDEDGKNNGEFNYPPEKWDKIKRYSLFHNPFIHSSVMFRKMLTNNICFYNNSYINIEDYELWTRLIYKYPCSNIPQNLIKYRIHNNQVTKKKRIEMIIKGFWVRFLAIKRYFWGF